MSVATTTEILMPRLSDAMEEGTILAWLIEAGQPVEEGQELLEVETDKANMTVESEASGILEILADEGATVAVGVPVARLGSESGTSAETSTTPDEPDPDLEQPPEPAVPGARSSVKAAEVPGDKEISATPLARRIALTHGLSLGAISGRGIGGRITKTDVLAAAGIDVPPPESAPAKGTLAAPTPPGSPAPAGSPSSSPEGAKGKQDYQELSRTQTVIARRMAESKATVPHFQVETEVRMDAAIELRGKLKAIAGDEPVASFNDFIVRATALALRDHPKANGSYRDGRFELHGRINVGIAVAADEALVVPTIVDADRKSLGDIGRESRNLAARVRAGEVTPPELSGGTFTVSNLGMFGMTAIHPVINVPQAAILGVGMSRPVLVRGEDGEIEDASMMTLTLSCDHRILYGAEAAAFLARIRDLLESPLSVAL